MELERERRVHVEYTPPPPEILEHMERRQRRRFLQKIGQVLVPAGAVGAIIHLLSRQAGRYERIPAETDVNEDSIDREPNAPDTNAGKSR